MKLTSIACANGVAVALLIGCSHNPPSQLVTARNTYSQVAAGPAATKTPAELHKARSALDEAERAFHDERGTAEIETLAYVAERKARTAEALARRRGEEERASMAGANAQSLERQQASATRSELTNTRSQLDLARQQTQAQQAELAREQASREDAERRAKEAEAAAQKALADLSALASVKKEERGTVITLSGSVLFASNEATLLPDARTRLDQVADVLRAQEGKRFLVEGHTDARGSDSLNRDLSERRAREVANYLVSKGVSPSRVESRGLGKDRPVADNRSAEGRANNRRVEIVVQDDVAALGGAR